MRHIILGLGILFLLASCAKPLADFAYQSSEKPSDFKFENKSQKAETYEWQFGDGSSSTEASPNHSYSSPGTYTVVLNAKKGKKISKIEKKITIEGKEICLVVLETDFGDMEIELFDSTPQHQDNFLKLVEDGFYDGLLFHRVIDGFMIQGGDPNSKNAKKGAALGSGGPGYTIPAEFVDNLVHTKGALSAARTNNPKKESSGSQFYIVHGQPVSESQLAMNENKIGVRYAPEQKEAYKKLGGTPFLDQNYTVFGRVIKGLEVIDKIAKVQKDGRDRPVDDVTMKIRLKKNN